MLEKKEFPILEFDENKIAKINPDRKILKYPQLPQRLIISFFKDAINHLLEEGKISSYITIKGENDVELFKYNDEDIILMHGKLGAAASGGYLDDLYGLGVRKVMFCGGGGTLVREHTVGKLVVIESAIRDEGLSYHYIAPSRYINSNKSVIKLINDYLDENNYEYVIGRTWTTDAFYRETQDKIDLRISEGAIIVEMEQSALIAVSEFRNIDYGAIVYCGDDLTKEQWDSRGWRDRSDIRYSLINVCKNIVLKM